LLDAEFCHRGPEIPEIQNNASHLQRYRNGPPRIDSISFNKKEGIIKRIRDFSIQISK